MMKTTSHALNLVLGVALAGGLLAVPASAQYRQKVSNDPARCTAGEGPAVMVNVNGISKTAGTIRVQSYRANAAEWLEKGKWLTRIEAPARAGSMRFCLPLPAPGTYGIAVRHDVNNNDKTDLSTDGGAMSNNPSLNIWNLGKPSYKKTGFAVGSGVETIAITMRYR